MFPAILASLLAFTELPTALPKLFSVIHPQGLHSQVIRHIA
jgi:hypothetical protein